MAKRICGIYKLAFAGGGFYIGSSKDIDRRFKEHLRELKIGCHCNQALKNACAKHGFPTVQIVLICRREDMLFYEQACIDGLAPRYNISGIAGMIEMTPEVREKISRAHKGRKRSKESVEKTRQRLIGRRLSPVHAAKCRLARLGKKQPPEAVARIIAFLRGRPCSEKTKAKISAAQKGKELSSEHLQKLKEAAKGRIPSSEHMDNLRLLRTGSKHRPESVEKIRASVLVNWQKRHEAKPKRSQEELRASHAAYMRRRRAAKAEAIESDWGTRIC